MTAADVLWMVVDRDHNPILTGLHREANAADEARELNASGLQEFAPYSVERYELGPVR